MKQYLEAGKIINTHSVHGEIKFDAWCDNLSQYDDVKCFYLDDEGREKLTVGGIRKFGRFLLIKFDELTTMDDALKYKNRIIYVDRNDVRVNKGAVFLADIIGLKAIDDNTGDIVGEVVDMLDKGSGNLYEIKHGDKTFYVPDVPFFIKKIDVDDGVYINVVEGLLD